MNCLNEQRSNENWTVERRVEVDANLASVRAQGDWTLTHTTHKDRTEHNPSFYHTRWHNTDWPTDQVITEWMAFSLPGDIRVSADKMSWTSNKPAKWAPYRYNVVPVLKLVPRWHIGCTIKPSGMLNFVFRLQCNCIYVDSIDRLTVQSISFLIVCCLKMAR
jgi:hypothetical protein